MPAFNAEKYISGAIESVLKQSYAQLELLLIDDGSTDQTLILAKDFATKDPRIKILSTPENSGAAVARNIGIAQAKGRWIAFLDADDQWLPHKLETQIEFMIENSLSFTFSDYDFIDNEGNRIARKAGIRTPLTYRDMLLSNFIGCLTAIYDQEQLGKIHMPLLRKRQDYGLWLRILKRIPEVHGIKQSLALYRNQNDSISSNKLEMLKWNWLLFFRIEKVGFFKSLLYLLRNIQYKIFK